MSMNESPDGTPPTLTRTDLAVYQALSSSAVSSPEELAEATELALGSATRSVDRLARVGLVVGVSPAAVPPEQALAGHLEAAAEAAAQVESAVTTLRTVTTSLQVLNDQLPRLLAQQEDPSVELLHDERALLARLASLFDTTTTSVHGMHPADSTAPDAIAAGLREHRRVLRRGVTVRSLHLHTGQTQKDAQLERLRSWGAHVRLQSVLPFRMLLFDGAVALCAVPGEVGCSAAVLRGSLLTRLLQAVFDALWAGARTLPAPGGTPAPPLPAPRAVDDDPGDDANPQQHLARLLAEGLSDRSTARRLGVTERTVNRRVALLFDELGASSRFQAGVEATRRGLV